MKFLTVKEYIINHNTMPTQAITEDYFYCSAYQCKIFPASEAPRICKLRKEIAKKPPSYGHNFANPEGQILHPNVEHCKTCEVGKKIRREKP